MHKQRDKREAGAYAYAVHPADNFDDINIARVADAQRPSRTEKAVQQMVAKGYHTEHVDHYIPTIVVYGYYQGIKIFLPVLVERYMAKLETIPEIPQVNHQKNQDNGSQQAHGSRIPFAAHASAVVLITLSICAPVFYGNEQRVESMSQYTGEQNVGY